MNTNFKTEGFIIALATAELYAVAFNYDAGYLSFFHIPSHLVRPSVTTIVLATIACIMSIASAIKFLNFITPLLRIQISKKHAHWRLPVKINCMLLIPSIYTIAIYPWSTKLTAWLIIAILAVNFVLIGIPVIANYFSKDKLPTHESINKSITSDDPLDFQQWIIEKVGRSNFALVFGMLVLVGLSWITGNAKAMQDQYFDFLEGPSPQVVLRSYDDYLLTKPIDTKARTFDFRYQIVPIGDTTLKLTKLKTGKLRLEEDVQPAEGMDLPTELEPARPIKNKTNDNPGLQIKTNQINKNKPNAAR
jgi:hypothetical protein